MKLVLKHESLRESNLTVEKAAGVIHPQLINLRFWLRYAIVCTMQRCFTLTILHNALIPIASYSFLAWPKCCANAIHRNARRTTTKTTVDITIVIETERRAKDSARMEIVKRSGACNSRGA